MEGRRDLGGDGREEGDGRVGGDQGDRPFFFMSSIY